MDDLLSIAERQIELFINSQMQTLPKRFAEVRASSQSISFVNSSRYVLALDEACALAIAQRGAAIWEILHRIITTGHVPYTVDLAEKLKNFSRRYLEGTVGGLTERAMVEAQKPSGPVRVGSASEIARDHAQAVLETEIDHFCAVLRRAPQATLYQPPHVININGAATIASIQTGSQSNATVTMTISATQQDQIRVALDELKKELLAANQDGAPSFLVKQAEEELAKPTPDRSKMLGFLDAVKGCVTGAFESAPKIPDAIEGVRKAIEMLS